MLRSIERFDGTAWATVTEVALEEPKVFHHHCHGAIEIIINFTITININICLYGVSIKSEGHVSRGGGPEAL